VIPKHRIVAVRQLRAPNMEATKTDDFGEFRPMVQDLVPAKPKGAPEENRLRSARRMLN
jgi:hypothetical protein